MTLTRALGGLLLLLLLIPSAWFAWSVRDQPQLGAFHDDSLYYVAARSLAQGEGYRIASFPGAPYQTKYPPAFAGLLSLAWRLEPRFPQNLVWATLLAWLAVPVFLLLSWRLFADFGFPRWLEAVLCAALALNPWVVNCSARLITELWFASELLAVSLLLARAARPEARWPLAAAAGALGGLAALTRTAALPMLLAGAAFLLLRRRRTQAAAFALAMLPAVAAWQWWAAARATAAGGDVITTYYTSYLGFHFLNVTAGLLPKLFWVNLTTLVSETGSLLAFSFNDTTFRLQFSRLVAAGAIVGTVRLARRQGLSPMHLFAPLYIGMLLGWHFPPVDRLLLPLAPLLAAGLAFELQHLCRMLGLSLRSPLRSQRVAGRAVAAALAAAGAMVLVTTWWGLTAFLPALTRAWRQEFAARAASYRWIVDNLPRDARILAYQDPVLHLYTGRQGCRIPAMPGHIYRGDMAAARAHFLRFVDLARARGLDYVLLTASDLAMGELPQAERKRWFDRARSHPELQLLYSGAGVWVYRVRPAASASAAVISPPAARRGRS
ncbi:MAG: hypothetical protein AAB225_22835 [Acidobacteriota bacterium]